MTIKTATIEQLFQCIKSSRSFAKCSLLVGAGCSQSAGIPVVGGEGGLLDLLEKHPEFSEMVKGITPRTYSNYMKELSDDMRIAFLQPYIDSAKVNGAHIAIAQLMKRGLVGRVYTTNFDSLVLQACALIGKIPAVYDVANAKMDSAVKIADLSLLYLHGQYPGFRIYNDSEELKTLNENIHEVLKDADTKQIWIVAGYSGENDPVFDSHLSKVANFGSRLYWIGYKNKSPEEGTPLYGFLAKPRNGAYFVQYEGDADQFFIEFACHFSCYPPEFIKEPFQYLLDRVEIVKESTFQDIDDKTNPKSLIKSFRDLMQRAQKALEQYQASENAPQTTEAVAAKPKLTMLEAWTLLMSGKGELLIDMEFPDEWKSDTDLVKQYAWALETKALSFHEQARKESDHTALEIYKKSFSFHQRAIDLKPDFHEAWNNWGNALYGYAQECPEPVQAMMYQDAFTKYQQALAIMPNVHEAWNNWGTALGDYAKICPESEQADVYHDAFTKYKQAVTIKPDYHESWNNWGITLMNCAKLLSGFEQLSMYQDAFAKYQQAVTIKPDKHEVWNNWGIALKKCAELLSGSDQLAMYRDAFTKFDRATTLKPDLHEAWNNWGTALGDYAKICPESEQADVYHDAFTKYKQAVTIKPDKHEAWNNWGSALDDCAKLLSGSDQLSMYQDAFAKYQQAVTIKPDKHEAWSNWSTALLLYYRIIESGKEDVLREAEEKCRKAEEIKQGSGAYNLACVYSLVGRFDDCKKWLEKAQQYGTLPKGGRKHLEEDNDLDPVRNEPWFQEFLEKLPS